ncbi:MAG: hypothetical protein COB84_04765 [Rhodobacteraceae bacterium]|nr:MAG: hypothetical protein COB84_04765 [Paracoccaceae bacterium]
MAEHDTDPTTLPRLGRLLLWVDKPGSDKKIFWFLVAICVVVFALDWTYEKHSYFEVEHVKGFYALYGFVAFTGLIFVAKALRVLIKRPEDYYAPKSIDTEDYPKEGTDIKDYTDV